MSGSLHVIAGPMFSGKTEEMLRLVRRLAVTGRRIEVFRPILDTRTEIVKSRSGANGIATPVDSSLTLREIARANNDEVVAVDEAQFFDYQLAGALDALADEGVTVIVSGLDKDFLGRPFGPMPALLASADRITMLTAVCTVCGEDATRTQRLIDGKPASTNDPLVVIGGMGDDRYEARCRGHHET